MQPEDIILALKILGYFAAVAGGSSYLTWLTVRARTKRVERSTWKQAEIYYRARAEQDANHNR